MPAGDCGKGDCGEGELLAASCVITRNRGSIWQRHEEVIQGSFGGFRGDAALH